MLFDGTTCNAECVQHLLYSNLRRYSGELYLLRSPDMKWSLLSCWTRKYKFPRFWILIENYMQALKRRWRIRTLLWTRYASSFYVYSSDFPRDKPTWISLTCAVSSRWRAFALSRCELSLLLFFFFLTLLVVVRVNFDVIIAKRLIICFDHRASQIPIFGLLSVALLPFTCTF